MDIRKILRRSLSQMESRINFTVNCTQMIIVYTACSISYANQINTDLRIGRVPNIKDLVCYEDIEVAKRKVDNNSPLVIGLLLDISNMLDELKIASNTSNKGTNKYDCKRSVQPYKISGKQKYRLEYIIHNGNPVKSIHEAYNKNKVSNVNRNRQ